jgi:hypothetical protein
MGGCVIKHAVTSKGKAVIISKFSALRHCVEWYGLSTFKLAAPILILRRYLYTSLHGVTSPKPEVINTVVTASKSSNSEYILHFRKGCTFAAFTKTHITNLYFLLYLFYTYCYLVASCRGFEITADRRAARMLEVKKESYP